MKSFDNVPDLCALYALLPDDRVAKVFKVAENRAIAEMLSIDLPKRIKEADIVALIREVLEAAPVPAPEDDPAPDPDAPVPPATDAPTPVPGTDPAPVPDPVDDPAPECQGCILTGRRWHAVAQDRPITIAIDRLQLRDAYVHAERLMVEAFNEIATAYPAIQFTEAIEGQVPDLAITAYEDDGFGGTLGFTVSYDGTEDADIDIGEDEFLSVRINMDPAESWNVRYFSTVFRHEMLHALGLDHAPTADDIMYAAYTGYKEEWGRWSHAEMTRRYIGTPA